MLRHQYVCKELFVHTLSLQVRFGRIVPSCLMQRVLASSKNLPELFAAISWCYLVRSSELYPFR